MKGGKAKKHNMSTLKRGLVLHQEEYPVTITTTILALIGPANV